MIIKLKYSLHFFLLSSLIICCDYLDSRLRIINDSDRAICFDYNSDTTLIIPSINNKEFYLGKKIEPGDTGRVSLFGSKTEWIKFVSKDSDSTLSIFIFDYNQVLNNNWDSLRNNKQYIRKDYNLEELQRLNWVVKIK